MPITHFFLLIMCTLMVALGLTIIIWSVQNRASAMLLFCGCTCLSINTVAVVAALIAMYSR